MHTGQATPTHRSWCEKALLLRRRLAREGVGAERAGRQAGAVVQIANRMVGPAVANRDGLGNGLAGGGDRSAIDGGLRLIELLVLAGDSEADRWRALELVVDAPGVGN